MKSIPAFFLGAFSVAALLYGAENLLKRPVSFSVGESDWMMFAKTDDFLGLALQGNIHYFPPRMDLCKERRTDTPGFAQAEPTCAGLLGGLAQTLTARPDGIMLRNFDEITAQTVTPEAACQETESGYICRRPFYFAKFHRAHFLAEPKLVADRAFLFTINLDTSNETVTVDALWSSSFARPDNFPHHLPVGL